MGLLVRRAGNRILTSAVAEHSLSKPDAMEARMDDLKVGDLVRVRRGSRVMIITKLWHDGRFLCQSHTEQWFFSPADLIRA